MLDQAFAILEFESLRALVRRNAQTDMGRARVEAITPIDDLKELRCALAAVGEGIELRRRGVRWSLEGVDEPSESLSRLKIEGTALEPLAILNLARLCERALAARATIIEERQACPTLFQIVAPLPVELSRLTKGIAKKILPSGELDDRASPELARIRRDLARLRANITRSLEKLMQRASDAIQDELVTVRNDRFVIPVRADHRSRINGVAHGISSSGATVFVEPIETIEANNELQTLRELEEREIANILFDLSEELRQELPALQQAANAVAALDLIGAKAAFAERFNCVVPEVGGPGAAAKVNAGLEPGLGPASHETAGILEITEARHPLLEENLGSTGGVVVPISFQLDEEHKVMVISGANAGGKTVVLKTAGLLSLMALSGLPVPAREARVPFYQSILADIGDHQSLAANLSTFTSHIANIASMIDSCAPPALVLLDEVGTGTDPEEGSALGVAVVDHFKQSGAHVLATTHYAGLKMYAANEPDVLNASVEFNEETLRPTYRLLVGIAGSSSGLEIAQRFGIPGEVISKATEQVKKTSRDAVEYLRRIKHEAEEAETLRKALEEERAAVAEKFAALDEQAAKHEADRQAEFERQMSRTVKEFEERSRELAAKVEDRASRLKVDREAARRAAELKREAQRVAQTPSKTDHGSRGSSSKGLSPQLRGVRVIRDGQVVGDDLPEPDKTKPPQERVARAARQDIRGPFRDLKIGDRVRLLSFGSVGIVNHIKDDEAEVRVGSLRMREKLSNLELVLEVSTRRNEVSIPTGRDSERAKPSLEDTRRQAQTTELHLRSKTGSSDLASSAELKLIGKKTDEAVDMVDKFLDAAFVKGRNEVRIIHGHGTGALRRAIAELLEGHPHVERFSAAPQDQGGTGATIIVLKA
jgi:DNA mismatch repair protein MutS2